MMSKDRCYYCKEYIDENNLVKYQIGEKSYRKFHKENKCYEKYLFEKNTKCYYCKKKVYSNNEYEENEAGIIHKECIVKKQKQQEWENLYNYVKTNILEYPKGLSLSKAQVLGLKSLAESKIIRKGHTQQYEGYSYVDIYNTFILKKQAILQAIKTKKFDNENAKFLYILAIVKNNINDVALKRLGNEQNSEIKITFVEHDKEEFKPRRETEKKQKLINLLQEGGW